MWFYIKSIVRKIQRNLLNSVVKLLGISIGLVTFFFITIFVFQEASYDKHIPGSENIYRLVRNWQGSGDYSPSTPSSLLNELKVTFPEITAGTRLHCLPDKVVTCKEKIYHENEIFGVDSTFLKTFNLTLTEGNVKTALDKPGTVIISRSISAKYFGEENPVGKTLEFEGNEFDNKNKTATVTGVFPDYPANTHFRPDFLLSLKSFEIYLRDEHANHSLITYIRLQNGTDCHSLESKFPDFFKAFYGNDYYEFAKSTYLLQPVTKIHLDTWVYPYGYETDPGDSKTLIFFPLLGLLILIIASINYLNLTIAEAYQNLSIFGINKILGATRNYFFKTFLTESVAIVGSAFALAIILSTLLLPSFGKIMERELSINLFQTSYFTLLCGILILILVLLFTLVPTLIFSRQKIWNYTSSLKKIPMRGNPLQQVSQVLQFAICIIFIIGSVVTWKQLNFIHRETNSGMKTDQVLVIQNARYLDIQRETFKQELEKLPFVKSVSLCNAVPGFPDISNWGLPIDKAIENVHVSVFECDPDYLKTLHIEMAEGRFFNPEIQSDQEAIVLNETAIRKLGWQDAPIGKRYRVGKNFTVIGVAKDVHFEALQYEIFPQAYIPNRHKTSASKLIVKLAGANTDQSIRQIESVWSTFVPQREMYYTFMDKTFDSWYKTEQKTSKLAILLSLIAILLSNFGLFAFILLKINQRIKEIGIRKVNGARVSEVMGMLNRDFVKWVAIAFVIATPIAYYAMNKWLENFAYKTELSWWIFALAGLLALGIALLTVSWQSWRAATRNPVEALRYE